MGEFRRANEERTRVQIRLLGGVQALSDSGALVDVGPAKCQTLLAALALSVGETVPVSRLVALVWGADAPRTAERTLQSYVTRLRKGLGQDSIVRFGSSYRLALDPNAVDTARFQRHLDADDVEAALVEWSGAPLAGLDAVGLAPAVSSLVEQWLTAIERHLERQVHYDAAATLAQLVELTGEYPFSEGLWALRMLALYRVGRQAEALAAYTEVRANLVEQLGVEPGPRLREVEALILGQAEGLHPVGLGDSSAGRPTGTVTFAFSDIESSTQMWADDAESMGAALARHDAIVRAEAERWLGYVFATGGDSFGIVFHRTVDAIGWANGVQEALNREVWQEGVAIRVRIGLHTGEANERDGDYFGPAVNVAARITEAGHGGQTLLSSLTAELAEHVTVLDLGRYRLRDVVKPQRILQLGRNPFPPLRTESTRSDNLPRQIGRLIGRERELSDLEDSVTSAPLTTLIGPGGIGKTRLAIEVARRVAPSQSHGTWLVELASIVDARDVARLVADALGLTETGAQSLNEAVLEFLEARTCLLVLDNCEHVISSAAAFARVIVERCPGVTLLATSREGLGIHNEVLVVLPPLEEEGAAVELFDQRAQTADPTFDLETNRAAVEEVCGQLDGVPLAIELAAARVRTLSPADLGQRLDDRLRLLTAGRRSPVERHRSLRATIEWSFDLLEPPEQVLFSRLSVFSGVFDVAAAEAVASDDELDVVDVDDLLGHLVDQSMVLSESGPFGQRFRQLETMRQFGAEKLAATGKTDDVGRRHAEWCADHVASIGSMLTSSDEVEAVARLKESWDNIRVAEGWALAAEDIALAITLIRPIYMELIFRGRNEIGDWTERLLELPESNGHELHPTLVHLAVGRYRWTSDRENFDRIIGRHGCADHPGVRSERANLDYAWQDVFDLGPAAVEHLRAQGMTLAAGATEFGSIAGLMFLGQIDEFEAAVQAFLRRWELIGAPTMVGLGLYGLTLVARTRGDEAEASRLLDTLLALERPPNTWSAEEMLDALRRFEEGDHEKAFTTMVTIVEGLLETENNWLGTTVCRHFVTMMSQLDRPREVARIMGFYRHMDRDRLSPLIPDVESYLETRMNPELEQEMADGRKLTNREALQHILGVFHNLRQASQLTEDAR